MKYKYAGISLLEILLVIAIGASILLLATRYFMLTTRNLRVTHAMTQIRELTHASYEWLENMKLANFEGAPNGPPISLASLIAAGLIRTNSEGQLFDPWGGAIEINPGNDPSYVRITLHNIPPRDCRNLATRLRGVGRAQSSNCSGKQNFYSGEF